MDRGDDNRAISNGLPTASVDASVGIGVYLAAVDNLLAVGAQLGPDDWDQPSACAGWTCRDLAGHVLCVVRWHHDWLDRSSNGEQPSIWSAEEFAARNQEALDQLEIGDGPARLAAFEVLARRYADRLTSTWTEAYLFPGGRVATGLHALLAAGEWHLHGWDLGRAINLAPEPSAAEVRDAWLVLGRDVSTEVDAWTAILRASGRA